MRMPRTRLRRFAEINLTSSAVLVRVDAVTTRRHLGFWDRCAGVPADGHKEKNRGPKEDRTHCERHHEIATGTKPDVSLTKCEWPRTNVRPKTCVWSPKCPSWTGATDEGRTDQSDQTQYARLRGVQGDPERKAEAHQHLSRRPDGNRQQAANQRSQNIQSIPNPTGESVACRVNTTHSFPRSWPRPATQRYVVE